IIVSESKRLEELTEDLLMYARPIEVGLQEFDIGELVNEIVTAVNKSEGPNVAFVVISGSDDYTIDTTLNGTLNGSPINGVITGSGYITGTITVNDNDIIKWITLDELRIKAGCQGAQLKILNNELPSGFQCSSYSATITADGGVPFASGGYYRWCRQESITAGLTFNPSTLDTNCQVLTETSWGQNNNLIIYGTPTYCGTFQMTFFARDNNDPSAGNDNIAQKALALTVNPATSGCTAGYRVWNQTGSRRDFSVDGVCVRANN
ncbi:MAG: hypothetical protein M0Z64_01630, partial [Nitrospiraceae bacterium]|nr:hypothetical protein [Nitrospiraceae bacterium]